MNVSKNVDHEFLSVLAFGLSVGASWFPSFVFSGIKSDCLRLKSIRSLVLFTDNPDAADHLIDVIRSTDGAYDPERLEARRNMKNYYEELSHRYGGPGTNLIIHRSEI